MKKLMALVLAAAMVLTASLALAKTVEPEETDMERLAGKTFHATVGAYSEIDKTFQVTVYENDKFDDDDIEELKAGDILLAGGRACTVKEMTRTPDGELMAITEDGGEIVFVKDVPCSLPTVTRCSTGSYALVSISISRLSASSSLSSSSPSSIHSGY